MTELNTIYLTVRVHGGNSETHHGRDRFMSVSWSKIGSRKYSKLQDRREDCHDFPCRKG